VWTSAEPFDYRNERQRHEKFVGRERCWPASLKKPANAFRFGGILGGFVDEVEENPQVAALMAEMSWLRRLARALLRTTDGAEDLVQDTWLAASEHVPSDTSRLRPWLRRVAVNLVRSRGRAEKRRVAREQATDDLNDPVRSPEELVRRIELQRLMADEVVRLDEPYRSTILLHYFEELSSAEIARRLDVPEGTVRRRLKVALDQLRERLGARDPKKARSLIIAFAPVAKPSQAQTASTGATFLGVIAMKKLVVALMILVLLIAAAIWWKDSKDEAAGERSVATGNTKASGQQNAVLRDRDDAPLPPWFAVRGASQRVIAGRVTFEGKPVPNAVVLLHDMLTKAGARPSLERRTGPDGKFDFGLQMPTAYEVVASAAEKAAAIVRFELADPTLKPPANQLELRLGGCVTSVAGTVFDASGGAISRARVLREGLVGVDADQNGTYKLCLPRGESRVTFSADGYGAVDLGVDAQGEIHQDVVLVPEAVIVGRVVEGGSERPVAGVYVSALTRQWGRDRAASGYALSDEQGRFRIGAIPPGRYRVSGFGDGVVTEPIEVVAKVGGDNPEVTLTVTAMARINGRIVSGGTPVPGASVIASLNSPPRRSDTAISQVDGTFVLNRVPLGDVSFSAAPYRVISPAHLEIQGATDHARVLIEVERLATIRGRVTRLGASIAGARVCCARTAAGTDRVIADNEGRYELAGVPPGTHRIAADYEELGTMMDPVSVTVAAGEEKTQDLEMDLAATISGAVVDQNDRPVKGVFVEWTNEKTGDLGRSVTDAQGRYRCSAMTGGGRYRAAVFATSSHQTPYPTADGAPYPIVELTNGKSVVDGARIAIDVREFAISGRVIDAAGEPVVDAEVKAMAMPAGQPPVFNSWMKLPFTVTGRDGVFKIAGLTPGAYALWARSPDGGEGTIANVPAGDTSATIRIDRPGSIEGKLIGFPAPPAVYASMLGTGAINVEASNVTTSSFRIGGLRPGRYVVSAQTSYEGAAQLVDVKSGGSQSLTLTARGRGVIDGTVLDFRSRAPIAGAICLVFTSADGMHGITNWDARTAPRSDGQGRVVLDPAPAGPITVSCLMPSREKSSASADVVLASGSRAAVQLLSAELLIDYPSTTGIDFDWRVTAPRIAALRPEGAAAKAGLLVGDLVVAVDGVSMDGLNGEGVQNIIDSRPAGAEVSLTVMRGAQRKTFKMKTEPRQL
jgi:RNA polymerase sigma-70 factor (ECF subfamily)